MKGILFLIFTLSLNALVAQNVTDSKGKKQGPWSKLYPGTKVYQYKGEFKDDKPVGTFTYYYVSSKVKAIIKHDANSSRSEAFYYHETGVLMSHGIYKDMKKDSIWLNFGPSGRISNSETYKDDLLNGKKTVYYVPEDPNDKSRIISAVYNYVNGKLEGEAIQYFGNGTIKEKGTYKDNKKVGVWETFHANGKKMMYERYKDGARHGWCYAYEESGKEIGKNYFFYGRVLQGKELEEKMKYFKEKGIDPNQ